MTRVAGICLGRQSGTSRIERLLCSFAESSTTKEDIWASLVCMEDFSDFAKAEETSSFVNTESRNHNTPAVPASLHIQIRAADSCLRISTMIHQITTNFTVMKHKLPMSVLSSFSLYIPCVLLPCTVNSRTSS